VNTNPAPTEIESIPPASRSAVSVTRSHPTLNLPLPTVDFHDIFKQIWRRKKVLLGTVLLIVVGSFIIVNQITPRYSSVAQVMIDPRKNQVVDIESVISGLPQDMEAIESELQILKSRRLAERVIKKLRLYNDPEFNTTLVKEQIWRKWLKLESYIPAQLYELLVPMRNTSALTEEEKQDRVRVLIVDNFLEKLRLARSGRSRVIEIGFESRNAKTSASVVNTLADSYIVEQLEAKFDATKRATEWLNERVGTLKKTVTDAERAVEHFRRTAGLIQGRGVTLAAQQISELNSQIIIARTQRAEAKARLSQVESLLRTEDGVNSSAEVLSSPLIQRLRGEESLTLRKTAELAQEFGDKHPRMITIRAELNDLRGKIKIEIAKIIQNLRNEMAVSEVRERTLSASLSQQEVRAGRLNSSEVQLRALEREADASRNLYETFLARFKETGQQHDLQQADARIISSADLPREPSFPRKGLIVGLALILSFAIGIVLIIVIEQLDHGFRSMTQIEQATGLPALGLIPMINGLKSMNTAPYDYVVEKPSSAYGESLRSLYTSILLSNVDAPPSTVLITSSVPDEGKTSLSISLARQTAMQSQRKVVLIDADLRRPQIHRHLGLPSTPGLVEYLSGNATIEEILHKDDASGAIVICSGGIPNNPTDVLASEQMKRLVKLLAETNDLVVIDSPPVLAVSDPKVLARLADKSVYVVRWAETRREVVMTGLKQISDTGNDVAGVVLSMVNVRRHAQYSYGDSGYYYGRARKYYTS
jgi:polysaccharide biosynthesis transport protein